jgi:hypothetical protein
MATTTNYGWTTPDDTALVKDGAAAIRTLGTSVDTTTKNLNPSTTLGDIEYRSSTSNTNTRLGIGSSGQVLTVAAGVPSWASGFANPLTTTGDTIYSSSGSTPARLGIGSTGNVLTVAGGVPTWAAPGAAGANYTLLNAGGTTLSGTSTTVSGISGKEKIMVLIEDASNGGSQSIGLRINADSGTKYNFMGKYVQVDTAYTPAAIMQRTGYIAANALYLGGLASADASKLNAAIAIDGGTTTGGKSMQSIVGVSRSTGNQNYVYDTSGVYEGSAVITSITVEGFGSSFIAGKVYVWASA